MSLSVTKKKRRMPVFVIIMSMLLFASGIIWGYMVIEIMSIEQVGHHD